MAADFFYSSTAQPNSLNSDIDGSATSFSLAEAPAGYPTSFPFKGVIDHDNPTEEIVYVTNLVGSTVTVTRGHEGTAGVSHSEGASFEHMMTGNDLQRSRDHEDASTDVHGIGATASAVGTDTTQTLTNKTIDGDDNTHQNIPQSAVTDLVSDQGTQDSDISTNAGNISSLTSSFNDHENDQTNQHGVSEIVGRTESQTLTNKTIDGDSNNLRDIPQSALDRAVLLKVPNSPNQAIRSQDDEEVLGSNNVDQINIATMGGSWGAPGHSSQWSFPATGVYLVMLAYDLRVTSNSNTGFVGRLRHGMTAGDIPSGSTHTSFNCRLVGFTEDTLTGIAIVNITDTSEIWGTTGQCTFSDTTVAVADTNGDAAYTMCVYLGPNS